MIMYNIKAAKELLAHYKSLTLAQLQHEWSEFVKDNGWEDWWGESPIVEGGDILRGITGFGTTGTCSLCNAINTKCTNCIYSKLSDCEEGDFPCLDITYTKVENSRTPEELYTNLQFRIERLEKAINLCENG